MLDESSLITWNMYVGILPLFGCWMNPPLLPGICMWVFCPSLDAGWILPYYLEYVCGYFAPLWMLDESSLITWNMYVGILPLFGCWMNPPLLPGIYMWVFCPSLDGRWSPPCRPAHFAPVVADPAAADDYSQKPLLLTAPVAVSAPVWSSRFCQYLIVFRIFASVFYWYNFDNLMFLTDLQLVQV